MKLATWNVNSIRARKERALAWLEKERPDVLCMQELKVVDDAFPAEDFEAIGYHAAVHGQKTYNGVGFLSLEPAADVARGMGDSDEQARVIAGTFAGVRVINVYVPNGKAPGTDKYAYKLRWFRALRDYLDRDYDPAIPTLLCGDMNVAPDDRDVYDPDGWRGSILCTDEERAALSKVVEWGFRDAFRELNSDAGIYTWWDYRQLGFPKNRGLRIDHIYVNELLAARLEDVRVDRDERKGKGPSDHAPVIATFRD